MSDYRAKLIIEKAQGRWQRILELTGINHSCLKNKGGPCPICGGKDRFRFDDKESRGTFFCNQCGAGDGIKLLQLYHQWSFPEAINAVAQILGEQQQGQYYSSDCKHIIQIPKKLPLFNQEVQLNQDAEKKRKSLMIKWAQAKPVTVGDPVDCYFRARGIELNEFPSVLRYHPQLPYYNDDRDLVGTFPALLAIVEDVKGRCVTIHRTYLGKNCKASVPQPKKLMSSVKPGSTMGAAIKLYAPVDGKLVLAEGIETAFALYVATHIPTWATVSANGMETVILPTNVTEVTIAIDNDESNTGIKSANKLRKRLLAEGRAVRCVMPPHIGDDFADLLVEEKQL